MPEAIGFTEPVILHEFEDGWKVVELRTDHDLDLLGGTMNNCWKGTQFGYWNKKILPGPEGEDPKALALEEATRRWDRPEYRKAYGDEWVEAHIKADALKPAANGRYYKLIAILGPEGELKAGSSLGLREQPGVAYGSCDGLHQQRKSWVTLDGMEFCCLELIPHRTGGDYSWNVTGDTLDHVVEWWKSICEGEWQEDSFSKCRAAAESGRVGAYA